jgi:hypothetical protein
VLYSTIRRIISVPPHDTQSELHSGDSGRTQTIAELLPSRSLLCAA